jgi:hypothetical protein
MSARNGHALLDAARNGDLESVIRLVAEGADVKESNRYGFTPFMRAAWHGHIPIMHWLLTEGGSSLTEQSTIRTTALLLAARGAHFPAVQYLLDERGASISESDNFGRTVWNELWINPRGGSAGELSSLLKVMVMLDDAPADFIAKLSPHDAELCTRGRLLRAQLPSYLEQQRAAVVAHCFLPAVLQSLIAVYATTTPEDMWADGLRVEVPRVKRGRTEVEKEEENDAEDARMTKTNRRTVNSWA